MAVGQRITEDLVVHLWERQLFDCSVFGRAGFELVYRGVPSDAGGPDYQNAILALSGGELVEGDVEFHIRSSDWYRHGHDRDTRYNSVVLHVAWEDDATVTRQDGAIVPTIALGESTRVDRIQVPFTAETMPHPCIEAFATRTLDEMTGAIAAAAIERFGDISDRFAADLSMVSANQVLYTGLMEGWATPQTDKRSDRLRILLL